MTKRPPRILSIAGSDSGGGAGIQADIRTISNLGGHAMTAVTAITAQNSLGVSAADIMTPEMVMAQVHAVVDDLGVDAIKIGMLGSPQIALAVTGFLGALDEIPVIFDPVMIASSGVELADDKTIAAFEQLIVHSSVVTPNLDEMARLGGEGKISAYKTPFLVKGGHGTGDILTDRLIGADGEIARWHGQRIETRHNHGTGCTLSAAIATFMGLGDDLQTAIGKAREYVRDSLMAAPDYGAGHGPMGVPRR